MSKQTILNYESTAAALNSDPGKRGPYKRGPKSAETASVVGVYEAPDAIPPMPKPEDYGWRPDRPGTNSGRGSFGTKAQEDAYNAAFDRHVTAVNGRTPPPVIVPRNNIPNRYDREALVDFYKDQSLDEARAHFDELVFSEGFSEKECFSSTLYSVIPNIYF